MSTSTTIFQRAVVYVPADRIALIEKPCASLGTEYKGLKNTATCNVD